MQQRSSSWGSWGSSNCCCKQQQLSRSSGCCTAALQREPSTQMVDSHHLHLARRVPLRAVAAAQHQLRRSSSSAATAQWSRDDERSRGLFFTMKCVLVLHTHLLSVTHVSLIIRTSLSIKLGLSDPILIWKERSWMSRPLPEFFPFFLFNERLRLVVMTQGLDIYYLIYIKL